MNEKHIAVKELPDALQRALEDVGYHARDIAVSPAETYRISGCSGDGYKAFSCMVNLETGEHKVAWGSWGGPNMFNPRNAVDLDDTPRPMPFNAAFIQGMIGGTERRCWASIEVHPENIAKMLPAPSEVTEREAKILAIHSQIKGGHYRKDELTRINCADSEIESLISRKLLSRNKAGSIQITTEGKNSAARSYY